MLLVPLLLICVKGKWLYYVPHFRQYNCQQHKMTEGTKAEICKSFYSISGTLCSFPYPVLPSTLKQPSPPFHSSPCIDSMQMTSWPVLIFNSLTLNFHIHEIPAYTKKAFLLRNKVPGSSIINISFLGIAAAGVRGGVLYLWRWFHLSTVPSIQIGVSECNRRKGRFFMAALPNP